MSNSLLYWIFLGIAFAVPFLIGVLLMRKTDRLQFSYWLSTAVNLMFTAAAIIWWKAVSEDSFRFMFGAMFFGISTVNVMILELFALLSIRKKSNSQGEER